MIAYIMSTLSLLTRVLYCALDCSPAFELELTVDSQIADKDELTAIYGPVQRQKDTDAWTTCSRMGGLSSKLGELIDRFGDRHNPARVLMLGLDAAGKTKILYWLKLNENLTVIPTIGFNVETINLTDGLSFTVWDVATNRYIFPLARHYFPDAKGVIYVVDSNNKERFGEAKEQLETILNFPEADGIPLVILANKQDLPNAVTSSEIADALDLYKLNRRWYIQETSAITGAGLYKALEVLGTLSREYTPKCTDTCQ